MVIESKMLSIPLCVLLVLLNGCIGVPDNITPVKGFELNRYLGKWYEIARLDHGFERGLERVSAEYSLREDGGVRVVNRGYSVEDGEWQQAEGKPYFVRGPDEGYLKVSFFGPFYGSYVLFELDREKYQYAFVAGPDKSYRWLLSRTPTGSEALMSQFRQTVNALGFDTRELIEVRQVEE